MESRELEGVDTHPLNGLSFAPEWAGTNVYLACQPVRDCQDALYPEERPFIATAGVLRQRTFSSGRQCARAALAEAGLPQAALPRAADGSVIWPDGVTGSLSHTNDWAVAGVAVYAMSEVRSLGVDLERIQALDTGVLDLVASVAEKSELDDAGRPDWQATALFSLKESVYKCLRPVHGQFIGFHEVEVLGIASGRPQLRFCSDSLGRLCQAGDVQLRMAVTPQHVFTLAWLRQSAVQVAAGPVY